jgi:hypothetical protein
MIVSDSSAMGVELDWYREVLVLYLKRPHETAQVRMFSGRALLIQRLEGSRPEERLCTLNGPARVQRFK